MKLVWNVPNALSFLRVLAAPALAYFLLRGRFDFALYIFAAAAFTDALDGFIARYFHLQTEFGAALDPLADKLVTLTCLLILTFQSWIPLWLTLAIVVRDAVIVAGAFTYHHLFGAIDIRPTRLGKFHTFAAFALFIAVLANAATFLSWPSEGRLAGYLLVLATALASTIQYVVLWGRKAAKESARKTD